jgi:hypothetical protein
VRLERDGGLAVLDVAPLNGSGLGEGVLDLSPCNIVRDVRDTDAGLLRALLLKSLLASQHDLSALLSNHDLTLLAVIIVGFLDILLVTAPLPVASALGSPVGHFRVAVLALVLLFGLLDSLLDILLLAPIVATSETALIDSLLSRLVALDQVVKRHSELLGGIHFRLRQYEKYLGQVGTVELLLNKTRRKESKH